MENIVDLNNPEHVRIYETLKQEQFGNLLPFLLTFMMLLIYLDKTLN